MTDLNPRVLRGSLGPWVGKRVVVGTTDFHYFSGWVKEVAGAELRMTIGGKLVVIPAAMVATINGVDEHTAEYMK